MWVWHLCHELHSTRVVEEGYLCQKEILNLKYKEQKKRRTNVARLERLPGSPLLWQVFSRWLPGLYGTPESLAPLLLDSRARPSGLPFCSSRGNLAGGGALTSAMLLTSSEFSLPRHVSLRWSIILSTSARYHLQRRRERRKGKRKRRHHQKNVSDADE